MSNESQPSYKQILKATSIFGGVQVINIVISIIRSKFIAVLLGPVGIGIAGMLTATTGIISGLTNFGLGTSAVRDISSAYESGNTKRIAIVARVLNRWVWITGLLGMALTLVLSPLLSFLSFGNYNYTFAFMALSITLLISQLNSGQLVILQGSRKISFLAKANLAGSIIGLFTTIPLYYIWGIDGIVPALVISAFVSLFISYYFRKKIEIEKISVSKIRSIAEGKKMLKVGFSISITGFITLAAAYFVRLFITHHGSLSDLGLYNSGFLIISTYVGLIFTAMATDYYPRLSGVAHDNGLCRKAINEQTDIAILILAPILIAFLVFVKWVVVILYSDKFIEINEMIQWAALGMMFKAVSWSIAFVFLAKGASKLFFWNELITNLYLLGLNLVGYYYWGLTGLGISFTVSYLLYMLQVYMVSKIKFNFSFDKSFITIFGIQFGLALISFLNVKYVDQPYAYIIGFLLIIISIAYSFLQLDKRMGLKAIIYNYLGKRGK